jgi:hypothetical protein
VTVLALVNHLATHRVRRLWRHAAPHPCGGQEQGHGHDPHGGAHRRRRSPYLRRVPYCAGVAARAFIVASSAARVCCVFAGLVTKVVAPEKTVEEALRMAAKIASLSKPIISMAKECVNAALEMSQAEGVKLERRAFHSTFGTVRRVFLRNRLHAATHLVSPARLPSVSASVWL